MEKQFGMRMAGLCQFYTDALVCFFTISIFLSDAKCGPVCRAHSGVEPSRSAKAFLQGGPKTSKKIRIFHHVETLVHISQKLLKIEACKQRGEKSFISPLSNFRMCLDPSVTWFCRVGQK